MIFFKNENPFMLKSYQITREHAISWYLQILFLYFFYLLQSDMGLEMRPSIIQSCDNIYVYIFFTFLEPFSRGQKRREILLVLRPRYFSFCRNEACDYFLYIKHKCSFLKKQRNESILYKYTEPQHQQTSFGLPFCFDWHLQQSTALSPW